MKFAIIDPVGKKAGMNCYDLGLLNALHQKKIAVYSFSNFEDKNYPFIKQRKDFFFEKKDALSNITNFIYAHFSAIVRLRREKIPWVLLHVFSTSAKDYLSFKLLKLSGRKIIAIIHDVESLSNEDKDFYKERIYDMADVLVVHNQTSLKAISGGLSAENNRKLSVIPHGNYVEFIGETPSPQCSSVKIDFSNRYTYLLFFGQIKPVKGLDILLKAMALLPGNYRLIIAGRPHRDDFTKYEQLIDELGLENRIERIIRFIADEERDYLFKQCDALILPYRKIFQSGVLLMAMSYGLPVVASDLPANKEVIEDGVNGALFNDGDAEALAAKVKILFSSENITGIKENALSSAENRFSWNKIADAYVDIIKSKTITDKV